MDREVLYKEYIVNKKSSSKISEEYNIPHSTIKFYLRKYDLKKEKLDNRINLSKEYLIEEYIVNNKSISNISEETGYAYSIVQRKIKKYNITKPKEMQDISSKNTSLKKYGHEYHSQNEEVKNKSKATCLEKYGHEYSLQNKDVIAKRYETNLKKYGFDIASKNPEVKEKMKATCLEKYGVDSVLKVVEIMKRKNETLKENRINKNYEHDGILDSYHTEPEIELLNILKEINIENISENDRSFLNGKEVDIYIPEHKVAIEFNGSYWHSEKIKPDKKYHYNKSKSAEEAGVFIYHIFGYEWGDSFKQEKIINQIKNLLDKNDRKIYARKCEIKLVDNTDKKIFLNENHIQGNDNAKILLGLYFENELVSIMTFTKPRFNKKYDWELSRYCSKANTTVVGGASKLFKYFVNNYMEDSETILSYSDIAKTKGNLYLTLGFKLDHISSPNYVWWKRDNDYKTRYQTQMKDEVKIMQEQGYYRIYDCGNKVWIYKKSKSD